MNWGVSLGAELGRMGSQVLGTEPISHHVYNSEEGHTPLVKMQIKEDAEEEQLTPDASGL